MAGNPWWLTQYWTRLPERWDRVALTILTSCKNSGLFDSWRRDMLADLLGVSLLLFMLFLFVSTEGSWEYPRYVHTDQWARSGDLGFGVKAMGDTSWAVGLSPGRKSNPNEGQKKLETWGNEVGNHMETVGGRRAAIHRAKFPEATKQHSLTPGKWVGLRLDSEPWSKFIQKLFACSC